MQARKILLVAKGAAKAKIINKGLFGPVTPEVPVSVLQHPNVIVLMDAAAGRGMQLACGIRF